MVQRVIERKVKKLLFSFLGSIIHIEKHENKIVEKKNRKVKIKLTIFCFEKQNWTIINNSIPV